MKLLGHILWAVILTALLVALVSYSSTLPLEDQEPRGEKTK